MKMKKVLKQLLPPLIVNAMRYNDKYGWFGTYEKWEDAKRTCTGYDRENILEKCLTALLQVKNGKTIYERDSVLFSEIHYSWPLVAGLMACAAENEGNLNVLDFGGSLGSSYFQNIRFLKSCRKCTWNIVEQPHFVACGKKHFENDSLKFYESLEACMKEQRPNIILLSSVLNYLE
jgi:putative methyltransferase (TIGR04325 family)